MTENYIDKIIPRIKNAFYIVVILYIAKNCFNHERFQTPKTIDEKIDSVESDIRSK